MISLPLKTGFELLKIEGFEGFGTSVDSDIVDEINEKYEISISSGNLFLKAGTRQGFRAEFGSTIEEWFRIPIPNTTELIIGGRIKTGSTHQLTAFLLTEESGNAEINLLIQTTGEITVRRAATNLFTTTGFQLSTNTEYFIELRVLIDNTNGEVQLLVDGVQRANLGPIDTQAGSNNFVNTVRFNPGGATWSWDDIYILDTAGSKNNTFLGSDIDVYGLYPDGDGNQNDWTPDTGGTNYTQVDDNPADGDTTYVESDGTVGHEDLYTVDDFAIANKTPLGVQVNHIIRVTTGSINVVTVARHSSTEDDGTSNSISSTSYTGIQEIYPDVPGGTGWTVSQIDAAEFGIKVVT